MNQPESALGQAAAASKSSASQRSGESSAIPLKKRKAIEKQPTHKTATTTSTSARSSKTGKSNGFPIVSQRTSLRIGSRITREGVIEPEIKRTSSGGEGYQKTNINIGTTVEEHHHPTNCGSMVRFDSSDMLSRMVVVSNNNHLQNSIVARGNSSSSMNSMGSLLLSSNNLVKKSSNVSIQHHSSSSSSSSSSSASSSHRNINNGLNFTFREDERAPPAGGSKGMIEEEDITISAVHPQQPNINIHTLSKKADVSFDALPQLSSGGGTESLDKISSIRQHQTAGRKAHPPSTPTQSMRFSLADSFVVKKQGKFQDDYECATESSPSSSHDGKKLIMLGRGGFGQVYLIKQRSVPHEERAMKIIPKFSEALREVTILKRFSHPNVVKIYEYFEDEQHFYIITERCYGYNLFDYIILKGQFNENESCRIADGVLRALAEAHKQNIVHRDVKPENIMLDFNQNSFTVKLIDWGLADLLVKSSPQNDGGGYLSKRCGTLHYLAPEVLSKKYNEKVDLWSLGMVLFTLIQGSPPICEQSKSSILQQIQLFNCSFQYSCWKAVSDEAKDLIQKLLERDPSKRLNAMQALHHPWFRRLEGTISIGSQDLRDSFSSLVKYSQANTFKKTVLGFFASHLISKRERNRYVDIFEVLDTDKNGELSVEELKNGFAKLFTEEEFELCHSEIDKIFFLSLSSKFEGASGIKYEEFLSSMLACSATYSQEQLYLAFQLFDKDNNGKINLDEIINTLEIPHHSDAVASFKQVIASFDENHDGELDFHEFKKVMTNFLDQNSQVILSQEIYLQ